MRLKKKIIILSVAVVIIHAALLLGFFTLNKKNELTNDFRNYAEKSGVKTLLLGDSHVARSVDASLLDSSYSLAYFGENNMMNYYKLEYCINHGYALPQYVILPCDIVTYTEGYNQYRTNKNFYYSIIPFTEIKNTSHRPLSAYYDYFRIKLFPYSEWQYMLNIANVNTQKKLNVVFSELPQEEQQKNARHFIQNELLMGQGKSGFYSANALLYLHKTIQLCADNRIKLVFVKFPLTKQVFDEIKLHVDSSFIHHRPSEDIVRKANIPILDFEYLFVNRPELFFDSHHLNSKGKAAFTPVLKSRLDSLYKVY